VVPRRFAPLIAWLAAGTALLGARLAWIQVGEHEVWAGEAANLVRSGKIVPYERGAILDRRGRVLAHDEQGYAIELVYRDFRRKHPLGQVAHAHSALEMRAVPLPEAAANLAAWGRELALIDPSALEGFGRGGELRCGALAIPRSDRIEAEDRRGRRSDLRFYVSELLQLTGPDLRALRDALEGSAAPPSFAAFAAGRRGRSVESELAALEERLRASLADLERLAGELDAAEDRSAKPAGLAGLVAQLQGWRAEVEDRAAGDLFGEAASFPAGRLEPELVAKHFDLAWLASLLRWDGERTRAWTESARADWLAGLGEWHVPRLVLRAELEGREDTFSDLVLDGWAAQFAAPEELEALGGEPGAWRRCERLAVLAELGSLFEGVEARRGGDLGVLPFQQAALRETADGFERLARAELGDTAAAPGEATLALAAEWRRRFDGGFDPVWLRERTEAALAAWEARFQDASRAELDRLAARAGSARLALAGARLDRAAERARFVLRDRGSRPFDLAGTPSYELIHLLTRYSERFAGFGVRDARERVRLEDDRGLPVAGALIGSVRPANLRERWLERPLAEEFDQLRRRGRRSAREIESLRFVARRVDREGELRGSGGVEGYFDAELSGHNGYREQRGLQEFAERGERALELDVEPEDGEPLTLTLDLDLQLAAEAVLRQPDADPDPTKRDPAWLARPTGAIVLLSVAGDVLAAASYPDFDRTEPQRPALSDHPLERTLRAPAFQPPGSVIKPLVAVWALDRLGLDPAELVECAMLPDGSGAGWRDLHCSSHWGHGAVDFFDALERSCNSYFASLGDRFDAAELAAMAAEFGLGQPTGIRWLGARSGLYEGVPRLFRRPPQGRELRLAANGLSVVEATPMQVARAYAGLATGFLPDIRLVERIGEVELEPRGRRLALSEAALERVRSAMHAVANEPQGSAYAALNAGELGFEIAAKTGSADISQAKADAEDGEGRVRKHTWLACWFPARRPALVLVVFVHDTLQTSSHTSVWIARQFLRRPEVASLLRELEGAQ
jgi:cell division protein FtsI/penicillin-binding protein 2